MKKTIASALFAVAVMAAPLASATDDGIKQFTVNDITVYPMLDSAGQMDAAIFSGPLSDVEKLVYMPGGKAPAGVNVFLLKTQGGNVLIDAGWGMSGPKGAAVTDKIKLSGLSPDDITMIALTHAHSDHIGGLLNGSEAYFKNAKILLSAPELAANASAPVSGVTLEEFIEGAEEVAASEAASPENNTAAADATPAPSLTQPRNEMFEAVMAAYGDRVQSFEFGAEIVPGLTAVEAIGHTPGHTAFHLKNGDKELLFIGDLLHAAALQFPEPEECASYDRDTEQAVATRKKILNMAAEKNLAVAGAHIPFPGTGFVKPDDKRGFVFTPVAGE